MRNDSEDPGLNTDVTRRDFLNGTLLGMGGMLIGAAAPSDLLARIDRAARQYDWTGYGGTGDYAASNGNTLRVLEAAHKLRDGAYTKLPGNTIDTGELYDVVIVGGGISGLTAAWHFAKATGGAKKALILENHPIFGGEAKQNEFVVNGTRLVAPQGSNQFGAPRAGSNNLSDEIWTDLALPRQFQYEELDPAVQSVRIPLDNYAHMDGVNEQQVDVGYFFAGKMVRNMWQDQLAGAPLSDEVKRDLLKWRTTGPQIPQDGADAFRRKLDTMTYAQYLEREMSLRPEVAHFAEPIVGLINGVTPDAVSAFASSQIGMPGVTRPRGTTGSLPQSFPGGNSTIARHYVKWLVPTAVSGEKTFDGVFDGRVDFAALDRVGQPTRIRLGATVVRVEHESGDKVAVAYEKDGRVQRVRARRVIMASGGWINKRVLADAPAELRAAYGEFAYAPALVINVALTNWRFMHKLGIAAARWFDDALGFSCNIRRPMIVGGSHTPLHPDMPAVLTFYMGLYTRGKSVPDQGNLGRAQLLSTPYADWERRIRTHLTRLFEASGFAARRDIAGIVLNRWGHARLAQAPGFYFGVAGRPSVREVVQKGYGSVVIAHSELNGHQSMTGAMTQGRRGGEAVV